MSHGIGLGLRYFIVKESQKRNQIRVFYLYCKYCRVVVSILNIIIFTCEACDACLFCKGSRQISTKRYSQIELISNICFPIGILI